MIESEAVVSSDGVRGVSARAIEDPTGGSVGLLVEPPACGGHDMGEGARRWRIAAVNVFHGRYGEELGAVLVDS